MNLPAKLGIGVAALAALWSGGWFAGKAFVVEPEADKAVEALRAGDLFFSFERRDVSGFPFAYDIKYENAAFSDASALWRWTTPTLTVGSGVADGGALRLTPSAQSKLLVEAVAMGGGADDEPAEFDISADDLLVVLTGDEAGARYEVTATSLRAVQAESAGVVTDVVLGFEALRADGAMAMSGDAADLDLKATEVEVAYVISPDGVSENASNTVMKDVGIEFAATGLNAEDLPGFIAAGGEGKFVMTASSFTGDGRSTGGPSAQVFDMSSVGDELAFEIEVKDGRVRYAGEGGAGVTTIKSQDESSFPGGDIAYSGADIRFEMPIKKGDGPEPYALVFKFDGMTAEESLWAMFDPSGAISRDAAAVSVVLGGDIRLLADLGDESFGGEPFDVETLRIEEIKISGLGVEATATGELDISGDASLPDGEVDVEVRGAFALLDGLSEVGMIPPGVGDLYRQMALEFVELGDGPDHLIAKIQARNGVTSINGRPLQ